MWRGPRGDGVSAEQNAPLAWSESDNIAWKSPIPGRGLSSPIVIGQGVYVTTYLDTENSRRLIRVDRDTGRIEWAVSIHDGPAENQHRFNSCASSTPAADQQAVYSIAVDNERMWVVAVDHAGHLQWKVSPGEFASQHGFAASPVLVNDLLIVNGHQDGKAFIVALDLRNGLTRWSYKPASNLRSFSTPLVTQFDGAPQLIVTGANQTVGLNPGTGECIWSAEGPNQKAVSSPSVSEGVVFSFAGSPSEKAMAIRLGGRGDVTQTHVSWKLDKAMPYVPSPVLAGGWLHVINDAGIYSCIEPTSGECSKLFGAEATPTVHQFLLLAEYIYSKTADDVRLSQMTQHSTSWL